MLALWGRSDFDIGITAGGALAWGVLAPTAGPMRGKLAGTYVGASGAVGVGVGVGANLLFGGSPPLIALQPLLVEVSACINLSLGVSSSRLPLLSEDITGECRQNPSTRPYANSTFPSNPRQEDFR